MRPPPESERHLVEGSDESHLDSLSLARQTIQDQTNLGSDCSVLESCQASVHRTSQSRGHGSPEVDGSSIALGMLRISSVQIQKGAITKAPLREGEMGFLPASSSVSGKPRSEGVLNCHVTWETSETLTSIRNDVSWPPQAGTSVEFLASAPCNPP